MVVLVDYRPRRRGGPRFRPPKIAKAADLAAFSPQLESKWRANPARSRLNSLMKSTPVRPPRTAGWTGLDGGNVTVQRTSMALSPAEKQRRYRERLKAAEQTSPDAI